jgi:YfiH family protein
LQRREQNGLVTYSFENLADSGLVHAVFTRLGGVSLGPFSSLNVGNSVGDDPTAVAENHARIYAHLDLESMRIVTPHQVHSNRVVAVSAGDAGQSLSSTDGLVTGTPLIGLLLRFADCQPILLYDPVRHALGLVHAGWRGVAQGIASRAVEAMQEAFGSEPQDLLAGLGPAIGPCCYVVGDNVAAAMGYALPDWQQVMNPLSEGQWRLDLPAANAQHLTSAGVLNIEQADLCTSCHNDLFFSHRADRGRTGRFAVAAYLKASSRHPHNRKEINRRENTPRRPGQPGSLHPPGFPAFTQPFEEVTP